MTKNVITVAACLCMISSTAAAQNDFREALRMAFPATVTVQTDDGGIQPQGRIMRREFGPLGGFEMMEGFGVSSDHTGFAVDSDLIATQLSSDVDEVTIKTADSGEVEGKVLSRDYVTGLTLIKVDGAQFVSLVVGAGVAEAGLPIVITSLQANGSAYGRSGIIGSGPATVDSQLGFTQYINADTNRSHAGAPIVDVTFVTGHRP